MSLKRELLTTNTTVKKEKHMDDQEVVECRPGHPSASQPMHQQKHWILAYLKTTIWEWKIDRSYEGKGKQKLRLEFASLCSWTPLTPRQQGRPLSQSSWKDEKAADASTGHVLHLPGPAAPFPAWPLSPFFSFPVPPQAHTAAKALALTSAWLLKYAA